MNGIAGLEQLCEVFYNGTDANERKEAERQLLVLQSSTRYLGEILEVFKKSANNYALLIAGTSLNGLLSKCATSPEERLELRLFVMDFLMARGGEVAAFVRAALVKLVARMTKLGWFDGARQREIVEEASKMYAQSPESCAVSLQLLCFVVEEFNATNSKGDSRSLTQQRKCAVSFRDHALYPIVQIAQSTLRRLRNNESFGTFVMTTPQQEAAVGEHSLKLLSMCLGFDFIGTNADESTDDVGTVQLPSGWRPVAHDPALTATLFDFFGATEPPRSSSAMESLVLLSSVRRSLFASETDRARFLNQLMRGVRDVLATRRGLQHEANYHEFCRLLGRLKSNYQLSELVSAEVYAEWLDLANDFTSTSFENWQWSRHSMQYLLTLWGRLVAAVPYAHRATSTSSSSSGNATSSSPPGLLTSTSGDRTKADGVRSGSAAAAASSPPGGGPATEATSSPPQRPQPADHIRRLEVCVVNVAKKYIEAMLMSVHVVDASDGAVDDPLDDDGSLRDQLERLPVLCRFQYPQVASFLADGFDTTLARYRQLLGEEGQTAAGTTSISAVERQLAWLAYIVAAVVGGVSWNSLPHNHGDTEECAFDASLSRRVFDLAELVDLAHQRRASRCDHRLELAVLSFLTQFRRVYLWEASSLGGGSSASATTTLAAAGFLSSGFGGGGGALGGSGAGATYPLGGGAGRGTARVVETTSQGLGGPPTAKQKAFARVFERLGLGDSAAVTNRVVTKIANNLRFWPDDEDVVKATLGLFQEMASGLAPGKVLFNLEATQFLVEHRAKPDALPFVARARPRHRTTLNATLGRLVLCVVDDVQAAFDAFLAPLKQTLSHLREALLNVVPSSSASATSSRTSPTGPQLPADVAAALVGCLRDLRGVAQACANRRSYNLFFDALYPEVFDVIAKAAESDSHDVVISALRLAQEVVFNKAQRITFDRSSPNGILLFREASRVVVAFGTRELMKRGNKQFLTNADWDDKKDSSATTTTTTRNNAGTVGGDVRGQRLSSDVGDLDMGGGGGSADGRRGRDDDDEYKRQHKAVVVALGVVSRALDGNYANLGVFELYDDHALRDVLEVAMRLTFAAPIEDVFAFPKLAAAYFTFYEVLFREHVSFVVCKDTATVAAVLAALRDGLEVPTLAASAAAALDHLATFRFANSAKPNLVPVQALDAHLRARPNLTAQLLAAVLNQLLFAPPASHWVLTRPVLSLMLVDERGFLEYRDDLVASQQSPDLRQRLNDAFATLVSNVHRNLEPSNRDHFTQALSTFRHEVRQFLVC